MITIQNVEQIVILLPPSALYRGQKRRQDVGKRPVIVCDQCGGQGLTEARREGGDTQICEACGGTGRAQ